MMMHIFLHLVVALTVFANSILLGTLSGFTDYPGASFVVNIINEYRNIVLIVIWSQIPIIYFIILKAYINPIQRLSREIAAFVTGVREEPEALAANTWSKGMNYITSFFIRSLQILRIFKDELRSGRQLRTEVEIASEIQKSALGHENPIIPSLEVVYAIKSATEVGGDSLDIIEGGNNNYYLYVGDATGHGVPSGFIMMMVNALISASSGFMSDSAQILSLTNKIVKPRVKQNMLMTCVLLRWNEAEKSMYFTGAGHEHILVWKKAENRVFSIKSGGVAIGMIRDTSKILKEQKISLDPEDIVVLYTDGVSEARHQSKQDGMLFGVDRIIESITRTEEKSAESIFQRITIDISAFMGYHHTQYDDITLMVIEYKRNGGKIITDLQERIPASFITEWNWGKTQDTSNLEKL